MAIGAFTRFDSFGTPLKPLYVVARGNDQAAMLAAAIEFDPNTTLGVCVPVTDRWLSVLDKSNAILADTLD
ncbi:MAG: hypothetical protein WBM14_12470 [Terracidiphilus sp.]|jgi:hypothetical protein